MRVYQFRHPGGSLIVAGLGPECKGSMVVANAIIKLVKLKWMWAIVMLLGLQAWAEAPKFLETGETYTFLDPVALGDFEATVLEIDAEAGWVLVRGDLDLPSNEVWLNLAEILAISPAD